MCVKLQLVERGVLLAAEPSSESLTTSDLDFSNLSLDTSMDQLSRMADSLASGVPASSMALTDAALLAGRAQLAGSMPASCGHMAGEESCDSLGSFEEQAQHAQHDARQGSKHSHATETQPQSRQPHRNRRSPSSLNRRPPSSPHACPTCDDLISEETQSAAGSLLSDLSCSELNSDPEAGSESEAELLRAAGASFQGRAARSGLQASRHARGKTCSVSCSEASSPGVLDTAPMQRSHATSHHTDMSNVADEHPPISSSHHRASAFQHSLSQMQLSPGTDRDGAATEDSSCFGSLSASQHSSPRQAHASRTVAAGDSKQKQASDKAAVGASSQDTQGRDLHPLSGGENCPETALSHSSRGAQQHSRGCSSHPSARQASGADAQPRDAASRPGDAPTQTRQAHAQTAEGRHSGLSGDKAVPHAARSDDCPSAVDRQSASANQRSKQQSRSAQDIGTAVQQRLHGSAESDAVASDFGLASLQSVSDGSLKRQVDADAASAASDEDSETDAHAAGQTPLAGEQGLAAWQAGGPEAEMSESEEEFERTLAHARQLRPSNQPHMHGR